MISSRSSRILSISILIFIQQSNAILKACSWSPMYHETRVTLFQPFLNYHTDYLPLQYDSRLFGEMDNEPAKKYDQHLNCLAWQKISKADVNDIYEIIYEKGPGDLEVTGHFAAHLKKNTFYQWLIKKENKDWFEYVNAALQTVIVNSRDEDPWLEDYREDADMINSLYHIDTNISYDHPALVKRYAFLSVRKAFYTDIHLVPVLYHKYFLGSKPSEIYDYWAMYYYGKTLLTFNDTEQGYRYLARVFLHSADKRMSCIRSTESEILAKLAAKETDPEVKTGLLALEIMKEPRLMTSQLQKITAYNSSHPILELLFAREIGKYEDIYLTERVTGYQSFERNLNFGWSERKDQKKQDDYFLKNRNQYSDLLIRQAQKHNGKFWNLSAGYFMTLCGNYDKADRFLSAADDKKEFLQTQLNICKWFQYIIRPGTATKEFENETRKLFESDKDTLLSDPYLRDRIFAVLYHAYDLKNDKIRAALSLQKVKEMSFLYSSNEYTYYWNDFPKHYLFASANAANAKEAMDFLESPEGKKSLLASDIVHDTIEFHRWADWLGTLLLREEKWEDALHTLKLASPAYWQMMYSTEDNNEEKNFFNRAEFTYTYRTENYDHSYGYYLVQNIFYADVTNAHKPQKADTIYYTKIQLAEEMIKIENKIKNSKGKNKAIALWKKANVVYNMTYYGNSWLLSIPGWSGDPYMEWPEMGERYFGCSRASELYYEAFKAADNREMKARCCLMLARCSKNMSYYENRNIPDYEYTWSEWLDKAISEYSDTRYLQKEFRSCGGSDEYISVFRGFLN
jgi:hypothetical protein